jgi:Trypsin-co-occurring domain 1
MKKLVEYKLADGNTVWVEIDEPQPAGIKAVSKTGEATEKAKELFEEALGKIKPATAALVAVMSDLGPDEATVEFGVKFSTKAGIVFASADTEANFVIKLTWKGKPQPAKP